MIVEVSMYVATQQNMEKEHPELCVGSVYQHTDRAGHYIVLLTELIEMMRGLPQHPHQP